jgi:RimJ/RimL family protein N-acetyltransferase
VLLETSRLLLRPISTDDLDDFVAFHSDPEVTRYISRFDRPLAEERLRMNELEWRQRGHGLIAVLEKDGGRFLGRAGIKYWPQFDETEVGWALRRDAWGRGYATEAARACVEWGFAELDVPYLTAMIDARNMRSIRVAEKLGLEPARKDVLMGDPVVVYAIDRSERG